MNIEYFEPLSRAWNRMKIALFKPFDITKWFVIGFSAFLAGLTEGNGSSGGNGTSRLGDDVSFREFIEFPNTAWEWLMDNPGWFIAIVAIVVVLFAVGITLTWLSSRGMFMFLDNVAQDKAQIAKPWKQYKTEGNSLFLCSSCSLYFSSRLVLSSTEKVFIGMFPSPFLWEWDCFSFL